MQDTQDVKLEDGKYIEIADNPRIIYEFEVEKEDNIYIYMCTRDNKKARVFVNGEEKDRYFLSYANEMINLGKREVGEKVKLEVCLEDDEILIDSMYIYYENEDVFLEHYNKLKENQVNFEKINSRKYIRKNRFK